MHPFHQVLQKYWGYSEFRPLQEDIISSVAAGNDTLGLMPTGGGKSLTFQVPALAREGICIVVSPLIALMKDQVENLKVLGIKAEMLFSGLSRHEMELKLNKCIYGDVKFLYVSPERLRSDYFKNKVVQMKVNLIAVDESHCISQWGYDFRPSYLEITSFRELFPDVPVLALTATATPDVVDDIQEKLNFRKKNVFQKSFERPNLTYLVRHIEDKNRYLLKILTREKGSAVVYVRSRKRCKEISDFLKLNKIRSEYYHAGLSNKLKDFRQNRWKTDQVQVMVATNAFGMGIDKPDVRVVVHMDLPDTLEAYFQEAGRAGRDGKKAYAVLLYAPSDKVKLEKRIKTSFPEKELIKRIYGALGNFFQIGEGGGEGAVLDFNMATFCHNFKFNVLQAYSSLKILQRAGYLELTDDLEHATKIHFSVQRDELYHYQDTNPKQEKLIRLMLRTYTGLFTDYVAVDEELLAQKCQMKTEEVKEYLVEMARVGMIKYIPRRKTPLVIFTQPRLPIGHITLGKSVYKDRKEKFTEKINAVIDYASAQERCHSQMLLNYFGQKNAPRCGKCDACREKGGVDLKTDEYSSIEGEIQELLTKTERSLEQLVTACNAPEEKVIRVVRLLLDQEKVKYKENKKMVWFSESKIIE
ncbi:MAG: ATP-dependent DNA helicase RecQ [Marinifilaceae bacterium]